MTEEEARAWLQPAVSSAALELRRHPGPRRARLRRPRGGALPAARASTTRAAAARLARAARRRAHAVAPRARRDQAVNVALTARRPAPARPRPGACSRFFARVRRRHDRPPHRRRLLGDVGANAPERWEWGGPGSAGGRRSRCCSTRRRRAQLEACSPTIRALAGAPASRVVARARRPRDLDALRALRLPRRHLAADRRGAVRKGRAGADTIRAGEFVLGYPNEYGQLHRPAAGRRGAPIRAAPAARRRGRLRPRATSAATAPTSCSASSRQDVPGFWRFVDAASTRTAHGTRRAARDGTRPARRQARRPLAERRAARARRPTTTTRSSRRERLRATSRRPATACAARSARTSAAPTRATRSTRTPAPPTRSRIDKRHRLLRRGREYGTAHRRRRRPCAAPARRPVRAACTSSA